MRFNKQELVTLASHSEHKFQKQGVLILREKSEGFFHRSENGSSQSKSSSKKGSGKGVNKDVAHSEDDDDDVGGFDQARQQQRQREASNVSATAKVMNSQPKRVNPLKKLSRKRSSLSCIGPINSPVSTERWFRLCGNLLFYLKSRDQWSEPVGVIVLENYTIRIDTKTTATYQPVSAGPGSSAPHQQQVFYFVIDFASGGYHLLGAFSEPDRAAWMDALRNAGFSMLRNKVSSLRAEIQNAVVGRRRAGASMGTTQVHGANEGGEEDQLHVSVSYGHSHPRIKHCGYVTDVSESPICEISLACDNLLCDAHGRPPNPKCVVHVRNTTTDTLHSHGGATTTTPWIKYANTELVEKSSNPTFLTTVYFRASDGLNESTQLRFTVYDMRERVTGIQVIIGQLIISLESLRAIDRIRLPISLSTSSNPGATVPHIHGGFLTIIVWNLEKEDRYSTESTPCRLTTDNGVAGGESAAVVAVPGVAGHGHGHGRHHQPQRSTVSNSNYCPNDISSAGVAGTSQTLLYAHRRTQSLPPKLGSKLKLPLQMHFNLLLSHPYVQTYRFHSGLGGDIFVHEIMAEAKLAFTFPQQLLSVWIAEEKELLQEMIGLGELREPWHSKQVQLLEKHLWLINHYTQARAALMAHKGSDFRPSSNKTDLLYEFVPVNLHLQRIWAQNESLHKNGFHDVISVGAFSAMAQGFEQGGLVKLLNAYKQFGETTTKSSRGSQSAWYVTNKVNMAYDSVQGIKRLRKEIVERMQIIMKLAKERKILGLHRYVEDIYHRCRLLLSICDQSLIEEAFDFLEQQKLTLPNSTSVEFDQILIEEATAVGNQLSIDEGIVDTPTSPIRSVIDLFKKRRNLEGGAVSGGGKGLDDGTPDSGLGLDDIVKSFLDSPSSNYYRPSEEPEPWDLTILNIEASMISLNSKIKAICGTAANIQPHSLRPSNYYHIHKHATDSKGEDSVNSSTAIQRTQSVKNSSSIHFSNAGSPKIISSDNWRKSLREETMVSSVGNNSSAGAGRGELAMVPLSIPRERVVIAPPDPDHQVRQVKNTSIDGDSASVDWSEELRSSIKKLRLAMDGILKTSRLAHCIFRLQENSDKSNLGYTIKYRRDVCFSHALTSLVFGIMSRLWCRKPDPTFLYIITKLGPLACFNGLLTYSGDGAEQMSDMMVAVEDLKTVEFVLVLQESSFVNRKLSAEATTANPAPGVRVPGSKQPVLFPLPKVYGSRSSLKVLLPIPETLLSMLPVEAARGGRRGNTTSFVVTPVFMNIGINQSATIAESLGNVGPQTKSNLDNYTRLNEYFRKYKKLILPMGAAATKRNPLTEPSLDTLFNQLYAELNSKKKKNVEVLHLTGHICRQMMGLRFTSCKSSKDRTGVAITLEQCQVLSQEYDLAEHEFTLALDAMRAEGCRRENVLKNCGSRKYNFNAVQVYALPKIYRPPPGSYGGGTYAME